MVLLAGAYFVTGWLTATTIARELVLGQSRYAVEDLNGQPVPAARDLYAGLGKPAPGDVDLRVVNFEVDGPMLILNFRVTNAHAPAVQPWSVQTIVRFGPQGWRFGGAGWNLGSEMGG